MKGRRKHPPRIPVAEFSFEFGDVNGIPLVEEKNRITKERAKKEK